MEADGLLCSRNARGLVCLVSRSFWSVWFFWMNFQSDQPNKPDRPDEPAFVRRAQWKINQPPSLERERANELGGSMSIHRHTLIDSSCKSAVRLRFWEGHGAQ
jgi:hypothetical protein